MCEAQSMRCALCNQALQPMKTHFSYLGHSFQVEMPGCPECGQIYIPEELVQGRIAQVESELEDK